eukprot:COSAG06_NODE_309_length_17782_cov_49.326698_4_plen_169_part_00
MEHGNKQVKVLIAKYEQPVRTGKNKGSNHCAVLKPGAAVLVCERWVELATTITRLRVRVRDEAEGCDKTHTALRPPRRPPPSPVCLSWLSVSVFLCCVRLHVSHAPLSVSRCHRVFSPCYTGWVRLADRDPKNRGNPKINPADNCRRQLFDISLGDEDLGEATEQLEV